MSVPQAAANLRLVPEANYWKGLLELAPRVCALYRTLFESVGRLFADQPREVLASVRAGQRVGRCAKWCPSPYHSFDSRTLICKSVAPWLFFCTLPEFEGLSERGHAYRARDVLRGALGELREYIKSPLRLMCQRWWAEINYRAVPAICTNNARLFRKVGEVLRRCEEGSSDVPAVDAVFLNAVTQLVTSLERAARDVEFPQLLREVIVELNSVIPADSLSLETIPHFVRALLKIRQVRCPQLKPFTDHLLALVPEKVVSLGKVPSKSVSLQLLYSVIALAEALESVERVGDLKPETLETFVGKVTDVASGVPAGGLEGLEAVWYFVTLQATHPNTSNLVAMKTLFLDRRLNRRNYRTVLMAVSDLIKVENGDSLVGDLEGSRRLAQTLSEMSRLEFQRLNRQDFVLEWLPDFLTYELQALNRVVAGIVAGGSGSTDAWAELRDAIDKFGSTVPRRASLTPPTKSDGELTDAERGGENERLRSTAELQPTQGLTDCLAGEFVKFVDASKTEAWLARRLDRCGRQYSAFAAQRPEVGAVLDAISDVGVVYVNIGVAALWPQQQL